MRERGEGDNNLGWTHFFNAQFVANFTHAHVHTHTHTHTRTHTQAHRARAHQIADRLKERLGGEREKDEELALPYKIITMNIYQPIIEIYRLCVCVSL